VEFPSSHTAKYGIIWRTGGLILPVFNDNIMASSKTLKGYVDDIGNDMSNGYVATRVWLDA
jgi:peptide/nickel transport system substrate-binding protein